ncbi:hypothetical protein [Sphingobium yanoikuyae]|uniref:hypothetical protein n=1 Tax=Sphingobium yanoikuyae TaxID=13690 RepID=UPI0013766F16|nr:hypothetical protein [Sphingobium yanoikuyae]NBB37630.1 hypothetical protein [Sphingobium yanoikuyae]
MGLGKIARGLGKVGLAFEALGYAWSAGGALVKAIKGKRSTRDPGDGAGGFDDRADSAERKQQRHENAEPAVDERP